MGYALIGLAVAGQIGSPAVQSDGLHGMLVYLAVYMVNLGTFAHSANEEGRPYDGGY